MIRVDAEDSPAQVATEEFHGPHDGTSLKVERWPVALRIQRGSTDEHDRVNGAVGLFLQSGPNVVHAGVALQKRRVGVINNGISVWEDEVRGRRQLLQELSNCSLHCAGGLDTRPFLE